MAKNGVKLSLETQYTQSIKHCNFMTKTNLQLLQCNDRAMIRLICSIKLEDVAIVKTSELLAKLGLENLALILRQGEKIFQYCTCLAGRVT